MQAQTPTQSRRLNRILNIAILFVALFCVALLVKKVGFERPPAYEIASRARLEIQGVDWAQADQTILLALSKGCHYCAESAPFYQRMVQQLAQQSRVRLIALFPENQRGGEEYLSGLGLRIKELQYTSLPSLGIRTFPTLALVDKDGVVTEFWAGKLGPKMESQVMRALHIADPRSVDEWMIDEKKLDIRLANREPIILLDVRQREAFAQGHKVGAKNIPLDELTARAMDELTVDKTVVVYGDDETETDRAYSILDAQGFRKIFILAG